MKFLLLGKEKIPLAEMWRAGMRPLVVLAMCLGACNGFGQSLLQSGQKPPTYGTSQASAPTLRAQASPTLIFVGSPTRINVEAQLPSVKMRPGRVILYRVSGGANQPIAELRPQGNGTVYTGQAILDESRVGAVVLEVAASYYAAEMMARAGGGENLVSNPITINVMAQQKPGNQGGGSPPNMGGGAGSSNSGWGAFGGGLAGGIAGAVLGKWIDSRHHSGDNGQQQPQKPTDGGSGYQSPPQPQTPVPPVSHPSPNLIRAHGLSIQAPAGWTMSQQILDMGGPIALRNFSEYLRGGIVPDGGAEIEITHVPQGAQSVEDTAHQELGATGAPQAVDGETAQRTFYTDEFGGGLKYENVAVYVAHANLLYKFFLSYRSGDPQKEKYVSNFDQVVASARFQ